MKFNFKRFLAFALALVMVLGYVPAGAFATEDATVVTTDSQFYYALKAGGKVKLGSDIVTENGATVPSGKSVVLDLNGYEISSANRFGNSIITNEGDLTVCGSGKLTRTVGGNAIKSSGTLRIEGGEFGGSESALVITGGTAEICGSKFINSTGSTLVVVQGGTLTITDGEFEAPRNCMVATGGEVRIEGGKFANKYETSALLRCDAKASLTITGGTFNRDVSEYVPIACEIVPNEDGTWTVKATANVAKVGDTEYPTLADAIANAQAGETIKLICDVALSDPLVIGENQDVMLDLNGYAISGERTEKLTANDALIRITKGGKLTVTDSGENGSITYGYTGESTGWGGYSASTIENNQGTLIIEGGKIVSTTTVANQIAYAVNSLTNGSIGDAYVTIQGGEIESAGSTAVRQFANSTTCTNTLVIEGGKITGRVQLQSSSKNDNKGVLTITGGEIIREGNTAIEVWFSGGSDSAFAATNVSIGGDVEVTGNVVFDEAPAAYNTKVISGGTFTADVTAYLTDGLVQGEDGKVAAAPDVEAPARPTATVTRKFLKDLTFAMNFQADEATDEQLTYYGDWYADFELTANKDVTFNANGGADGYLSGQYDAWSENWVNVPFEDVTLEAHKPLKIMEYAATMMGEEGLKLTYNDIVSFVKDFDCGVFFEEAFLKANPDLEVKLELRMYNNTDESESYVIGETYVYTQNDVQIPMPTATVSKIVNDDLTFAMNFLADEVTAEQLAYYGDWYADFELTVNKRVTFNANGGADGYLSGQYDAWSENWVSVPTEDVTLQAGQSMKIMEYAATMMGKPDLKLCYKDVYEFVKSFDCGVYFEPEFLEANPDLEVKLELRMYDPKDTTKGYTLGEPYIFNLLPELPDAEVIETENDKLTFAATFVPEDTTPEQLAYYGDWYADFELVLNRDVVFNADGSKDGYVSCQYDALGENWINIPAEDLEIKAGKPVKLMELLGKASAQPMTVGEVMELMGAANDDDWELITYGDVVNTVKEFNCGVYFTDAYLAENTNLNVTVELKMYNPDNVNERHTVGSTYTYTPEAEKPEVPTATVTEVRNDDLTFAMNFLADEVTAEQLAYYGDWYADFELTVNKKVTFNANGGADGYLSGQYDAWSENWVNVPFENVTLEADKPLKIMEYAAKLMGEEGLKYTYGEVYNAVKDFDCGVYFEPAFLKANPDLVVTLELKMYDPDNQTEGYVIGETYIFDTTKLFVAENLATGVRYTDVSKALEAAASNETVALLLDAEDEIVTVLENTTLDLNGFELKTKYAASFGNIVDNSEENTGRLNVDAKHFLTQKENAQLPVNTDEGYMFVDVTKFNEHYWPNDSQFMFQFYVEEVAHSALKAGKEASGVSVEVEISWSHKDGTRSQNFVFNDTFVQSFLNCYNPDSGGYDGKALILTLTGAENLQDLQFRVVLRSETGVVFRSEGVEAE